MNINQLLKLSKANLALYDGTNKVIIDLIIDKNPELKDISKDDFLRSFRLGRTVVDNHVDYIIKAAIAFVDSSQTLSDLDLIERQERRDALRLSIAKGDIIKTIELLEDPFKQEGQKHYKVATVCTRCKTEHVYSLHYLQHPNFKGCSTCRNVSRQQYNDYSIGSIFGVFEIMTDKVHSGTTPNGRPTYRVGVRCTRCGNESTRDLYSLRQIVNNTSCRKCKKVGYANHRQKNHGRIFKQAKTGKIFEIVDSTPSVYENGKRIKTTLYKMENVADPKEIVWNELSNLNPKFHKSWIEISDETKVDDNSLEERSREKCQKNVGRRFKRLDGKIFEIIGFKTGKRIDGLQVRPLYYLVNIADESDSVSETLNDLNRLKQWKEVRRK